MAEDSGGRANKLLQFVFQDHFNIIVCSTICLMSVLTSILLSWMMGVIVMSCFVAGILITLLIISPDSSLNVNFLFMLKKPTVPETRRKSACSICDDATCNRHTSIVRLSKVSPWHDLTLPKEVDKSLHNLLENVIKEFIYTWYSDVSNDETFVAEVRNIIRHVAAVIYSRAVKIDLVDFITNKVLKATILHLDCYLQSTSDKDTVEDIQKQFFLYLNDHIHIGCTSRRSEVVYLRELSQSLLPFLLPPNCSNCRSTKTFLRELLCECLLLPAMDVLADPDNVNDLLLVFFDEEPMLFYPDATEKLPFLHSFTQHNSAVVHSSPFNINLQLILNDNQLFYSFMSFLKKSGAVNILQFCLCVEDFNKKILGPDWKVQNLKELKSDMLNIFKTYCDKSAVDRIDFDDNVIDRIEKILDGPTEDMRKFHSSDVMLIAYDHAYKILEGVWCHAFYHSSYHFNLLCGNNNLKNQKSSSTMGKGFKKEISTVSKLGSKLRDVFKTSTSIIDGHTDYWGLSDGDPVVEEATFVDEELDTTLVSSSSLRDLSAWRVAIPNVELRMDSHNKHYYVFIIEVQRIDVPNSDLSEQEMNWSIERKYTEFYVLDAKLTEFHGEILDIHLPAKKMFSTKKSMEFMKKNKGPFETFLKKLLVQPSLKGSELLFNFLTSHNEFTEGFLPDIGIGKIFKTVPMKLRKEKGQNLESFLNAFMLSTEQVKPNLGKLDWEDVFEEEISVASKKLENVLYGDNADINFNHQPSSTKFKSVIELSGIFDYALYLFNKVFCCPFWFMSIIMALKVIGKTSIEVFFSWFMNRKLQQALKPRRIAQVIDLLTETLFHDQSAPRSVAEKAERKTQVFTAARNFLPSIFIRSIGQTEVEQGMEKIIAALQHPKINKQLSYVLLDIAIEQLFPELSSNA